MAKHLLTDREIRNAKCPLGKPFKRFSDGEGLYLVAFPSGSKSWQFRYDYDGKEQIATLKDVDGLKEAREEADRLREIIAAGDDPRVLRLIQRVEKRAANAVTFEVVKDAWVEQQSRRQKWSPDYHKQVQAEFRNHLAPLFPIPVDKIRARITAPMLAECEKNAPGVVDHVAQRLYAVMDYALKQGYLEELGVNPLPKHDRVRTESKNFPAITKLAGVGEVLRAFDKIGADRATPRRSQSSVRRAHLLLVFTAQRISEVVNAQWKEFDLEAGLWEIPRERMKMKSEQRGEAHTVPLPPLLLRELRAWREADGRGRFVCPSARSAKHPVCDSQVGIAYRHDLELKETHSPHSWRAVFSTICRDAGKDGDVIEAQLDHIVGNAVVAAYDRSQRLELRRELMTWYEVTILAARDGATVLPLKQQA